MTRRRITTTDVHLTLSNLAEYKTNAELHDDGTASIALTINDNGDETQPDNATLVITGDPRIIAGILDSWRGKLQPLL